jgi:pyruvate/2-oxoglutarate dehydrogenase complex dihydrolipoamide dehydrogenase (E3) component/uncharacterized membrane protein YdjX (TVP38/TMEM64 family)
MHRSKLLLAAMLAASIFAFFALGLNRYLSIDALLAQRRDIDAWHAAHPLLAPAAYFAIYVAITALSVPGAVIATLAGGALFGLALGTALVSFASSIGATLAFLSSRFLLRDWVRIRFADRLQAIDEGMRREGAFYLFALRLVPVVPFFAINLAMGLTSIRTRTFYGVSQLGMLAGTLVYVYAGTQLGAFRVSPQLLGALALLGVFPLAARRVLRELQARRLVAAWPRPARFDYNVVVIGAGSGGLVSAYIAAATRARVALVEQERMGGDCLNTGCVPSKALIRAARLMSQLARGAEFGVAASAKVDFARVMQRVADVVRAIEPHDSVQRYTELGVQCLRGRARISSPWTVTVDGSEGRRTLTTRSIVIATGAGPRVPPVPGLREVGYLTSETVWNLRELPPRLLVLGGGPIGSELAQAFCRLGSKVTVVEMLPRLLAREDPEVSELLAGRFRQEGIELLLGHRALRFEQDGGRRTLVAEHEGRPVRVDFDQVLVAVGRQPRTADLGLEALGIPTRDDGTLQLDAWLRTRFAHITACGDVAGPYQFTHVAAHQAWYATVNALFGRLRKFRADYRVVPWATFVDPEIARVGLNEQQAREQGLAHDITVYRLDDLDRAIADGEPQGFVKVLTAPGSDRILGATVVGSHAADCLAEYVLAMRHRLGLNRILGTIHVYPTMSEASRYAAGRWRRSRVTLGQWGFLDALQAWLRGQAGPAAVLGRVPALLRDRRKAYGTSP